jgi:hypothetical protein
MSQQASLFRPFWREPVIHILAGSYEEAWDYAKLHSLGQKEWYYIDSPERFMGAARGTLKVVKIMSWATRNDLEALSHMFSSRLCEVAEDH